MSAAEEYLTRLKDRLFLDWEDPVFRGPLFVSETGDPRARLKQLVSLKSEDALTWSVFRAFTRLPTEDWLIPLLSACNQEPPSYPSQVDQLFWRQAGSPRPLTLDLVLEAPAFVVVVEGKSTSDIASTQSTDQIARCLDVALDLAGPARDPYFLLISDDFTHEQPDPMVRWLGARSLGLDEAPAPVTSQLLYERLMPRYRDDPAFRTSRLPHRSVQDLARLEGRIAWLTWANLIDGVLDRSSHFRPEQKRLLQELVDFLRPKRLLHKGS